MNAMEQIMPIDYWLIFVVGIIAILPYFLFYGLNKKLKEYKKAYLALQTSLKGNSIDDLLSKNLDEILENQKELKQVEKRLENIETKLRKSVDRVELIRFNAFEKMGSDLSFAMALLNQDGDGVVVSSINNRDDSRVYAKPIVNGESSYNLSEEEKKAIIKASETIKL